MWKTRNVIDGKKKYKRNYLLKILKRVGKREMAALETSCMTVTKMKAKIFPKGDLTTTQDIFSAHFSLIKLKAKFIASYQKQQRLRVPIQNSVLTAKCSYYH